MKQCGPLTRSEKTVTGCHLTAKYGKTHINKHGGVVHNNTHQRRGKTLHLIVSFTVETQFSGKMEESLSRDKTRNI